MAVKTTNNLVPIIKKEEYDAIATDFLSRFCEEALETPMPVPITAIAEKKMGLIILSRRLTEDFSVFGQMCFTRGRAQIYDKAEEEYREIIVSKGTMIIDPDTYELRNEGCMNNTIAHESVHWDLHRNHHFMKSLVDDGNRLCVAHRCPIEQKKESPQKVMSDEDWMELQANGIAPRILMPIQTVGIVFEQFMKEKKLRIFAGNKSSPQIELFDQQLKIELVIDHIAEFYNVSRQSARIRLQELGYLKESYE